MKFSVGLFLIFSLLILVMMTAGCAKMPQDSSDTIDYSTDNSASGAGSTSSATEQAVTFSTPIPTTTQESTPTYSVPPSDSNPEDNYSVVYEATTTFNYNIISMDYTLNYPPMVFYYSGTVPTVIDKKEGTSSFGSKDEFSVNYESPNPLANYKVTVYDKETDEIIYTYDIPQFADKTVTGKFKIFEAGDFHIEITGNLATIKTTIKVPQGNIVTE